VRLLFVKDSLSWPRSSGPEIHCFHMMRALSELGHDIGLLTVTEPMPEAIQGLRFAFEGTLSSPPGVSSSMITPPLTRLQRRFQSYWGIPSAHIRAVGEFASAVEADAVIVVGLDVLPYVAEVRNCSRIWYAADEWLWHHISQVKLLKPTSWAELKTGLIKALYERAYGSLLDRIWVVTDIDSLVMRCVSGVRNIDVVPNGVDSTYFRIVDAPQRPKTCTFWGRLDFGPNVQALQWFCSRVWPQIRATHPDAAFTIYGFKPTAEILCLSGRDGIQMIPDLPDLRESIATHQAVVFPFVSGGGIKNKFLEAAAMGKAIVCSKAATAGLRCVEECGASVVRHPREWVQALTRLWANPDARTAAGLAARHWAVSRHDWSASAKAAAGGLERQQPNMQSL
jgi:glycosyltransferase involved in cell wall biosynthesis